MPNLPGRYEYSVRNERDVALVIANTPMTTVYYPCLGGCDTPVPDTGRKCSPCAALSVAQWVKEKRERNNVLGSRATRAGAVRKRGR